MNFEEAKKLFQDKLGIWKIMALATCVDNVPMIRNVSCLFYHDKIYFKTDINFRKTAQLLANPKVAMCFHGLQVESTALNKGLVINEEGRIFEKLYKEHLWGSYNKYSHEDTEIIIEITPKFVEIWDTSEDNYAFQIFIDFEKYKSSYSPL